MIVAVDTSSLVAFLSGMKGKDVNLVAQALEFGSVMFPPVVVTEILSDPKLNEKLVNFIHAIPKLEIVAGYFERSAIIRRKLIKKKLKARLGDALIAQSCIDHKVPLITRDKDFRHYSKFAALQLL